MRVKIFPFKIYLHILQLEEYSFSRFYKWLVHNYFKRTLGNKKPLVITKKIKNIMVLSILFYIFVFLYLFLALNFVGILFSLILLTQFYIFITLGLLILRPYELINRALIKHSLKKRMIEYKRDGLKVIGITGSFGKTSVKETLYQILKADYKVLRTPGSYNTLFGIKKVVDYELDSSYDYFICEMGAYVIGEIAELCDVFLPDYAILTGINEQHIERFGSIENTTKAKFELPLSIKNKENILLNFDNKIVKENASKMLAGFRSYGKEGKDYKISSVSLSSKGSAFNLSSKNIVKEIKTDLIGFSKISNITSAYAMATILDIPEENVIRSISKLKPVPHRLEIKELHDKTILIDDAYSANVSGFYEALDVINLFKDKVKIIVTPGIVELGKDSYIIHKQLGEKMALVADFTVLVGKTTRTKAIEAGLGSAKRIYIDSINKLWDELKLRYEMGSGLVILLENDLPDNY